MTDTADELAREHAAELDRVETDIATLDAALNEVRDRTAREQIADRLDVLHGRLARLKDNFPRQ